MNFEDPKLETLQDKPQNDAGLLKGEVKTKRLKQRYPDQSGKFSRDQYEEMDREIEKEMASDQVRLIKELSSIEIPVYLVGGYAYELLLLEEGGEFKTQFVDQHRDFDMTTNRENSDILKNKLRELGFKLRKEVDRNQNETLEYVKSDNGVQADFTLFDINPETNEVCGNSSLGDKKYKVCSNLDIMKGKTVVLDGVGVKNLSPCGLIQSLLVNRQIGLALREKDRIRAERLCAKYFPGETLDSELFKVRVEEIAFPKKEELVKS